MGHVTYEEQFVGMGDYSSVSRKYEPIYMEKCHPDFCKICFSKMYQVDTPGGGTELRTDLKDRDGESMFEPDGYGGASKVSVRPHIAQGTACGWGNTTATVGANLWHADTWPGKVSICQQDDTIDEAVETMFIRPGGKKDMRRIAGDKLTDAQLEGLCGNPSMLRSRSFSDPDKPHMDEKGNIWRLLKPSNTWKLMPTPTIDETMPED